MFLQQPRYRSLLVNGSGFGGFGARFYPLNMEQDFGEAHTEVARSTNVSFYGSKSENNYVRPRRAITPVRPFFVAALFVDWLRLTSASAAGGDLDPGQRRRDAAR